VVNNSGLRYPESYLSGLPAAAATQPLTDTLKKQRKRRSLSDPQAWGLYRSAEIAKEISSNQKNQTQKYC